MASIRELRCRTTPPLLQVQWPKVLAMTSLRIGRKKMTENSGNEAELC